MSDQRPLPTYDEIAYESLPNEFRNLPRLPPRRGRRLTDWRPRSSVPLAGPDWFLAWPHKDRGHP